MSAEGGLEGLDSVGAGEEESMRYTAAALRSVGAL